MTSFLIRFFETEIRAWHGEVALAKVFWGYGVLVSATLALLYLLAIHEHRLALQQALLLGFAAFTVWALVSIWRCADRAEPFWGWLARWLSVAWAANAALLLAFLQIDLLAAYLRP